MNLIEVLRVFKPGLRIKSHYAGLAGTGAEGVTFSTHEMLVEFLAGRSGDELLSDDWSIMLPAPDDVFWKDQIASKGYVSTALLGTLSSDAGPVRPEATAIANLLRQDFDTKRPDEIVREMWLAMQLLTTPECCADFIRRAVVIPA
ncbi:TPA: hypothetical protein KEY88_001955 [Serratia marcescens]|nr:hypothetical protein [Serratia marcescens]